MSWCPLGILEALDVVEHIGLGLIPCPIRFGRRSSVFARAAHAAGDAVIGDEPLELLAGVLAATVGVMLARSPSPENQ